MSNIAKLLEAEIPRLRRYARTLTQDASRADDLVQSCLVRALTKQHLWQPGTDLRAWLFTILHNQHVNDIRRLVREGVAVPVDEAAGLSAAPTVADALQLRDLERASAALPQEQREVIRLVAWDGMRYEEIATTLGVPLGTVRSRVSRARARLRELMDGTDETRTRPRKWATRRPWRRAA